MLVDFHSHTRVSDGALAPAELLAAMRKRGVEICSITDHDQLGAYAALADELEGKAPSIVTGVEINTTYRGDEVHVLGYGFSLDDERFTALIDENRAARERRAQKMVDLLRSAGYDITMEDVRAKAGDDAALGRPHVARVLVAKDIARDLDTAFRLFLTPGKPGYVPSNHISPHDAIAAIAKAGGVAVLAHPGRVSDGTIIDELAESGLLGLEVFYPSHSMSQISYFRKKAEHYGLVMTAGSDFHDHLHQPDGVGMDVDADDIDPFLDLVLSRW